MIASGVLFFLFSEALNIFISSSVYVTIDPGTSGPPLSLLRFVCLNFVLSFSGPCSQECLVFSLSRAKEVSYASPRICSSVQNKEEPPAHFTQGCCLRKILGSPSGS